MDGNLSNSDRLTHQSEKDFNAQAEHLMEQDLIKAAAEALTNNIEYYHGELRVYDDQNMLIENWNPLKNSNHTDMLRDKLVEMGFEFKFSKRNFYWISVWHGDDEDNGSTMRCEGKESINLTWTKCCVEAIRKLNTPDKQAHG